MLRLAEADALPFAFSASADAISGYAGEVVKLADELREETEKRNRLIREKRFEAAADPRETFVPPKLQEPVPAIEFAPLKSATARLALAGAACDDARRAWERLGRPIPEGSRKSLDEVLFRSERALTRPEGLPRRPWYRHLVYAPGFYTGYGVKTLPGVREAFEERDWTETRAQIDAVSRAIERYAADIDRAAAL